MSKVLVMDSSYENCQEAVEQAFAAFPVDCRGKKVAVKVNALKACDPDGPAMVTHYRLLQAVLAKLASLAPGEIVVGDSVGTESYGNSDYVFATTRLKEVAGPYYRNFNKNVKVIELEEPFKRKVVVLQDILDADVYISMPKMKTHGLTLISGAVKNNYGLLTGGQKSWYHYYSVRPEVFARILVEMYRLRPPDLVIMDGILAMEGYGPASSETRRVNKVLAASDGVAMDVVQAEIIGFGVDDVPYLQLARDLGLGETDPARIEVVGDHATIAEYRRPTLPEASYSYRAGVGSGSTSIDYYRDRVAYRPFINREQCPPGCSDCTAACPSGALFPEAGIPALDVEGCLGCSVCKESCAPGALVLKPHETVIAALLAREERQKT